ncbi:U32 family peptidase [Desulfobacterales bacterium HSG16]|nr:U32 family peptidase [Desulfobacterales bacterium HSG16]
MTDHLKTKPELLAPVGNFEKLEIAIHYGADAVYLAGKDFSLRNFSQNFTTDELKLAVRFAHDKNIKAYLACNIYSRNHEQEAISQYLETVKDINPDALIVSDPGIIMEALRILPDTPLHLSTQANTTNYKNALFWEKQGIKRVNTARELSLSEIKEIGEKCGVEIEAFVHGAMCISYSGRCLLSSFMANREANRGMCCHPCRFEYSVVEASRPGRYFPIAEDNRGTYMFNSKDLCMIEHIPELVEAGVDSFKIEGRMKGIHYLATAVKVYREAIDAYWKDRKNYMARDYWLEELAKVGFREYCTGFYLEDPTQIQPNYKEHKYDPDWIFSGKIMETETDGQVLLEVRNRIFKDSEIEILSEKGPAERGLIDEMLDLSGLPVEVVHPGTKVKMRMNVKSSVNDLLRVKTTESSV